jgi:hypothetical protein
VGGSGVDLGRVAFPRTSTCWLIVALTAFSQQMNTFDHWYEAMTDPRH